MKHLHEVILKRKSFSATYSSAEELLQAAFGYFDWVISNPMQDQKVSFSAGEPVYAPFTRLRVMTIGGLCAWLGVSQATFEAWANPTHKDYRKELVDAVRLIEQLLSEYLLSAAWAGMGSENLTIRLLKLKDIRDVRLEGALSAVRIADVSEEELAKERERRAFLEKILEE